MGCEKRITNAFYRAIKRAETSVLAAMKAGYIREEEDITAFLAASIICEISKVRVGGIKASPIVIPRRSSRKNLAREKTLGADLIVAVELLCGDEKVYKTISFQAKRTGVEIEGNHISIHDSGGKFADQLNNLQRWTIAAKGLAFDKNKILTFDAKQIEDSSPHGISGLELAQIMRLVAECREGDTDLAVSSIEVLEELLQEKNAKRGIYIWIEGKGWTPNLVKRQ